MGGEERVERQRASGRLTVRERIERLFDEGTFHETGALAGAATYGDDGELDRLPPREHGGRAGTRSRAAGPSCRATTSPCAAAPPTPRSGRRWSTPSGWPTTCGCRSCAWSTGRAAAGASSRSRRWASPTCPSCPGFELTAANLSRVPVVAAALGPVAGLGAARVVASHFSVIVRGHRAAVRGGPARRGRRDGRGRPTRRSSAAPAPRLAPARWTTWPPTRTTPSRSSGASSPTCRAASGRRRRSPRAPIPPTAARRSCSRSCPASGASPTTTRRILELVMDRGLGLRDGRRRSGARW